MPEDATHLDEELVWLKLVAACALRPSGLEPPGQVRREFQIAQRGYDDGQPIEPRPRERSSGGVGRTVATALQPYVADRDGS